MPIFLLSASVSAKASLILLTKISVYLNESRKLLNELSI